MKRVCLTIVAMCFVLMGVWGQSPWRMMPEGVRISKKLRNTFVTNYYNHELEIERMNVENNRALVLRLRCPSHSLEYRTEVKVSKRREFNRYADFASVRPEESLFFLPGETARIAFDLSFIRQNGEYCFTFQFHTELNETFYVLVYLNTKEYVVPRGMEMVTPYLDYQKLQEDEDFVYSWIERYAEFPGGNEGLARFLKENVRYENLPDTLDGHFLRLQNSSKVGMIIDKDGSILYPEILHGGNPQLNAEAMRLVHAMPKWKAGTIDGVKVKQRALVWIHFKKLEASRVLFESGY